MTEPTPETPVVEQQTEANTPVPAQETETTKTKVLVFTHPFGNSKPGDEIEVPADASFSRAYLTERDK